jgi:hypothetical protein
MRIRFIEDVQELKTVFGGVGPFKKDEEMEMPQPVAVFFVCKGSASISN